MTKFNFLDAFGMTFEEFSMMQSVATNEIFGDKGRLSRLTTAKRAIEVDAYIGAQLWECKRVLSKIGLLKSIQLAKEKVERRESKGPGWEEVLEKILLEPLSFRNPSVWLMFHACQQAERDFALDVCPAHSREDVLTGRFLEGIKGACAEWKLAASSYLSRVENTLELSSIDLTVGGGEQQTGGDFALILDIREGISRAEDLEPAVAALTGGPRGDVFIPLLFQAKCYHGTKADISQKHHERGYQFNRLRQTVCASNYIFYENAAKHIALPSLPLVKPASQCEPVELSPTTATYIDSTNFSTYLLRAANGFDSIPVAATREDALNMILANISPHSVTTIAILGNTSALDQKYRAALVQLQNEAETPDQDTQD